MRRTPTRLLTLAIALTTLAACEAPLKPESEKQATGPSTGPSASSRPTQQTTEQATRQATPSPTAIAPPKPSITVPKVTPLPKVSGALFGGDISWPQCPRGLGIPEKRSEGIPLPLPEARFVVIGLTNGPGFVANPCLADQVRYARQRKLLTSAYSVISGPTRFTPADAERTGPFDGSTRVGALSNIGFQQARFNIDSMKRAGFSTPFVWLDIETVPKFDWSSDKAANAAVIRGAAKGYTDGGYGVGVYSTPYLFAGVAGGLRLNVPEWRAAGQTSRAEALSRCGNDWVIQGGRGVLAQWVAQSRDLNVTCPGATAQLGRFFHQY